ncbi:hypothetical protein B0H10DRAFT_2440074, partial [Mycena sp. CBHHK59/15]
MSPLTVGIGIQLLITLCLVLRLAHPFLAAHSPKATTVKPVIGFALYPLPMYRNSFQDTQYTELYPRVPRLYGPNKFFVQASDHSLTFEFEVPEFTLPDVDRSLYPELNAKLVEFMSRSNLSFPPQPLQPTIHAEQGSEFWHAITFQNLPWTLVQLGAKPRASTNAGRILTDAQLPWHSFTVAGFKAYRARRIISSPQSTDHSVGVPPHKWFPTAASCYVSLIRSHRPTTLLTLLIDLRT